MCFVREEFALPPNFNKVIQTRGPATAVKVLHQAAKGAERSKFFCCERCPHKVNTFQVGVAVVNHIVSGVPQAEWRERVQEGVTANPLVQFAVRREALVTSVMANDEQTANHEASRRTAQKLQPQRFEQHGASHQPHEQGCVNQQENKGAQRGAIRQGLEPLANDFAVRHVLIWRNRVQIVGGSVCSHK